MFEKKPENKPIEPLKTPLQQIQEEKTQIEKQLSILSSQTVEMRLDDVVAFFPVIVAYLKKQGLDLAKERDEYMRKQQQNIVKIAQLKAQLEAAKKKIADLQPKPKLPTCFGSQQEQVALNAKIQEASEQQQTSIKYINQVR